MPLRVTRLGSPPYFKFCHLNCTHQIPFAMKYPRATGLGDHGGDTSGQGRGEEFMDTDDG